MDVPTEYLVNTGFSWIIVLLAIAGYFLTLKRMGERWVFWIILAIGWAFFALAHTLLIIGVPAGTPYLAGIWISSYLLVMASLVILFIKLTRIKQRNETT